MSVSKCSSKEAQLQVVLEALVQAANQICQFSQRDTELNAERFVQTLVLGWLRQADASLNELAQSAQDLGVIDKISSDTEDLSGEYLRVAVRKACHLRFSLSERDQHLGLR